MSFEKRINEIRNLAEDVTEDIHKVLMMAQMSRAALLATIERGKERFQQIQSILTEEGDGGDTNVHGDGAQERYR